MNIFGEYDGIVDIFRAVITKLNYFEELFIYS